MNLDQIVTSTEKKIEKALEKLESFGYETLEKMAAVIIGKYPMITEFCTCNGGIWFTTKLELNGNFGSKNIDSIYAGDYEFFLTDWLHGREDDDLPPDWVKGFLEDFGKLSDFADFLDNRRLF